MASLMPNFDFDDISRFELSSVSSHLPVHSIAISQKQHSWEPWFDIVAAHMATSNPPENPSAAGVADFRPIAPRAENASSTLDRPMSDIGVGNPMQNQFVRPYSTIPQYTTIASRKQGTASSQPSYITGTADRSKLTPKNSFPVMEMASSPVVSSTTTDVCALSPSIRKRRSAVASSLSEEKLEERRRKNRESSSRCYYNRKRKIEELEHTLTDQKRHAINLYSRELDLRNQNALLKKELVLNKIPIPTRRHDTPHRDYFASIDRSFPPN